ncbi:MAG: hypothetical protein ACLSVD_00905 [Eggerthellaceae bacterium]
METYWRWMAEGDVPGSAGACSRGWAGHDGVRHPRRGSGGDRHHHDHRVPIELQELWDAIAEGINGL